MNSTILARIFGLITALFLAWPAAHAALVMPDFDGAPTGWSVDRYAPAGFHDIGTFQGHNDVLAIDISSVDGLSGRPVPYQSQFYNTQGRQHAISGSAGSVLSAELYIPKAWESAASGNVRTDMWGVMNSVDYPVGQGDYPIIGFTNYGGAARLRVYDADTAFGWVDLAVPVTFDAWMDLAINFTGSSYVYKVNNVEVYEDTTTDKSTTGFMATIMQAYNFCGDTSIQGAVCKDYTAHWSNSEEGSKVPTPASFPLALLALGVLGGMTIRQRRGADHLAKTA